MSDLAPFVAATLRDKVVVDLQNEKKKLRDLDLENKVRVTGSLGIPLYASAHIDSTEITETDELRTRTLPFENNERHVIMSEEELERAEIYVGLKKERLDLGRWEQGSPVLSREDEQGRCYYEFPLRDWQSEFQYPELRLEVGPCERAREQVQVHSIEDLYNPNQFRQDEAAPKVNFLKFQLHDPSERLLGELELNP